MLRLFVVSILILGVSCSKKSKENVVTTSPAPQESKAPPETVTQPAAETKTETKAETKTKTSEQFANPAQEAKPVPSPEKPQTQPPVKAEVKEAAKPAAEPRNQQTITLAAGQFKTMEFSGNTRPLVNGGTSQVFKLSDISRLKLLGVRFELNLSKVPLDHIISYSYAGRFDIYLTTDTGLRKICGEGFAETPVQVKGRKPGRPFEITFPRVLLSSFMGEDDCATSVSKSNLTPPVVYSIAPVNGKTQLEVFIHEPIQISITDHLNEAVAPETYPVGFNVILQTEISN